MKKLLSILFIFFSFSAFSQSDSIINNRGKVIPVLPIKDGGTNNGSLSVTAGTIYYGDGTKLIGLVPGNANQILHSGATPVWKDTAGLPTISNLRYPGNVTGSTAAFNASSLFYSVYNVLDWGFKNDSSTDNLTAGRAFFAMLPDGASVYMPGGGYGTGYIFSDSILINKSITIYGDGYAYAPVTYTGITNSPQHGATNLYMTSGSNNLFCIHKSATNNSPQVSIHDLSFINTQTTPTAGAAITFNDNITQSQVYNFSVQNFFNGINVISGNVLSFYEFYITGCVQDALILGNNISSDYGGYFVYDGIISSGTRVTTIANGIHVKDGGGGVNITRVNFNGQIPLTFNTHLIYPIFIQYTANVTSEIHIVNCHINNYQNTGIKGTNSSGTNIGQIIITDSHSAGTDTGYVVDIDHFQNMVIEGMVVTSSSSTKTAVNLNACTNVTLGAISFGGTYTGKYTLTGCTSIYNSFKSLITTDYRDGNLYISNSTVSGASTSSNFLSVIGTFQAVNTAQAYGALLSITSAGSSVQQQAAEGIFLQSGYTGNQTTYGTQTVNFAAGVGNTITGQSNTTLGNIGTANLARGASATGTNIGSYNDAQFALRDVGLVGVATANQTNSASALSGGVIGLGLRSNASAIEFGGYFGLQNSQPTFTSAALIANNGGEAVDIFEGMDNGTIKVKIADGGFMGVGTTTTNALLQLGAGTATANTAPLKFTSGTNLTTAEAGAVEYDGTHFYGSSSTPVRQQFDNGPVTITTGINAKTTATTTLYTVPTGRTFIVTDCIVRVTAASAITIGLSASVTASTSGTIYASSAMTTLTATPQIFQFPTSGISVSASGGETIGFVIGTAATGTSQTVAVDLIGYLL